MSARVVALSGGVGGAKLVHGLSLAVPASALTVIVNTGDDFEHLGLHISPDIDSVVYALAGLADAQRGWGRAEESWQFMHALKGLGGAHWFQLGDRDLAMHVERTQRLAQGRTLSEVTAQLCAALGIGVRVLPMSDDAVRTQVRSDSGWLDFQDYFVRQQCRPAVRELRFAGAASARAQPEVLAALRSPELRAIVLCPSNPFVSLEPILAVPGIRAAIMGASAPVIAVTPIIGGQAVKGPAAKMMAELGLEVSAGAVARRYQGLVDVFVLDSSDAMPAEIARMRLVQARTLMKNTDDRLQLAHSVLALANGSRRRGHAETRR